MPTSDGVCLVGEAPESRRWAMAMISTNAPAEPDAPSWYWITPPDEAWPAEEVEAWLEVFSASTLPAITVHEVAPGHFSHHQALRRTRGDTRRTLFSSAFVEGWAHYAEELCVEEGFLGDDPRFAVGIWLEALVRVTRLACALGVHTAGWTVEEATSTVRSGHPLRRDPRRPPRRAARDVRSHATAGTPGASWRSCALRERARSAWGPGFTLKRFHTALMDLGAPPLGLIDTALDRG